MGIKTVVAYEIDRVVIGRNIGTAYLEIKRKPGEGVGYSFARSMEIVIPEEVACKPGDSVAMTLDWG